MDVFILAAGKGKRMANTLWPEVPKCLLPYKGKAILAHIIDSFLNWKEDSPTWLSGPPVFYVAVPVGDKLISSYVLSTYGSVLDIRFVEVKDTGAGPINSFMELAMFRDTSDPFVVTVSDCVMDLGYRQFLTEGNFLGCSKVPESQQTDYLNIVMRPTSRPEYVEKQKVPDPDTSFAWSGLAFIHDARHYIKHAADMLDEFDSDAGSEVSYTALFSTFKVPGSVHPLQFFHQDFLDLGTSDKYNEATKAQNVWAKGDQITYPDSPTGRVVKYFKDHSTAANFVARGTELRKSLYLPTSLTQNTNFVSYVRAPGESIRVPTTKQLIDLLNDLYTSLWREPSNSEWVLLQERKPKVTPLGLFSEKTKERLIQFCTNTGTNIDAWLTLLDDPKWATFSHTKLGRIHGDLTLDNIVQDPASETYTFIDWRPSTCTEPGSPYGDVYYDLAKLWLSIYLDLAATRELGTGVLVIRWDLNLLVTFQAWCKLNTFDDVFDYETIVRQAILLMAAMSGVHTEPVASGFFNLSLRLAHHVDASRTL
jgi:hypothetical protein